MDVYLIVGNSNTRRSSVIRSLTGCFNRSLRDILPREGTAALRVYARAGALQDTKTSPADFIAEVGRMRCDAVLCGLNASIYQGSPAELPAAPAYVDAFCAAGWRIRAIAVLGQNGGGLRGPNVRQFAQAPVAPINATAADVRALFGWR
jgi:hypothetical protein